MIMVESAVWHQSKISHMCSTGLRSDDESFLYVTEHDWILAAQLCHAVHLCPLMSDRTRPLYKPGTSLSSSCRGKGSCQVLCGAAGWAKQYIIQNSNAVQNAVRDDLREHANSHPCWISFGIMSSTAWGSSGADPVHRVLSNCAVCVLTSPACC